MLYVFFFFFFHCNHVGGCSVVDFFFFSIFKLEFLYLDITIFSFGIGL